MSLCLVSLWLVSLWLVSLWLVSFGVAARQSDYGVSFLSQATPAFSRRHITIDPVQMSLQLGLANVLGIPVHKVYEQFEVVRDSPWRHN